MSIRLPAEWENQDGILLPWPHPETDWRNRLVEAEKTFIEIAVAVSRFERILIIAPETGTIPGKIAAAGGLMNNVEILNVATDDTWARDFGPITVYSDGTAEALDFTFNGWGEKFPAVKDNLVTSALGQAGLFRCGHPTRIDMVLEGGSFDSDGDGSLLTTTRCLLNPNRNPALTRNEIEQRLREHLGVDNILWLDAGMLLGDDTDAHVDILARFAPGGTILYVRCDDRDDPHFDELGRMRSRLESFTDGDGRPFRLVPLPMPSPCFDDEGQRLAATYANFLVINNAVLVPTYDDPNDNIACKRIAEAFSPRQVIPIDCRELIRQGGSLHCSTMQLPEGVLT